MLIWLYAHGPLVSAEEDTTSASDPEAVVNAEFKDDSNGGGASDAESEGSSQSTASDDEVEVEEDFGIDSEDIGTPLSTRQASNIAAKMAMGVRLHASSISKLITF